MSTAVTVAADALLVMVVGEVGVGEEGGGFAEGLLPSNAVLVVVEGSLGLRHSGCVDGGIQMLKVGSSPRPALHFGLKAWLLGGVRILPLG